MIALDPMWLFSAVAGAMIVAAAIDECRQIKIMRTWGAEHGLPLRPPTSTLRVAQAFEALQPTMGGQWDGLPVLLWTRPVWITSLRGVSKGWRVSIRVTAERDLVPGVAPRPDYFKGCEVNGRELRVFTRGGVRLEEIRRYLTDAVAYAKALTPME